ncbi:MAG: tRNA (guanosine(37)-N1)-methyltransferase TrmD [Patescibacteria group bacterium]
MKFDIITIFPNIFEGFLSESLLAKAQNKKIVSVKTHYLRKWTSDRHQTVDGKPYGGGPGLVFKVEPVYKAVTALKKQQATSNRRQGKKTRVVLFSPRGKKFDQATAKRWSKMDQIIFICGRYEGVDERIAEYVADEVVSIGDYVLNGGEVAAMVAIEAVSRLLPGFMHKEESSVKDDHAQYTKPEVFYPSNKRQATSDNGWRVPKVLLSGNHKKIVDWRKAQG